MFSVWSVNESATPVPYPPPPQKIAPPNSQAQIQGGGAKRALPPPLTKSWIHLCV